MTDERAATFAKHLMAHADKDEMIVDLTEHDDFHLAVAKALEDLGYRIDVDPFRPRLTIHRQA